MGQRIVLVYENVLHWTRFTGGGRLSELQLKKADAARCEAVFAAERIPPRRRCMEGHLESDVRGVIRVDLWSSSSLFRETMTR